MNSSHSLTPLTVKSQCTTYGLLNRNF